MNRKPVTIVFTWDVKKGKEEAFQKWAHEITTAAAQFEGHLGANWITPQPNSRNFTVIYKFDTLEHFGEWENSEIRHQLLKKVQPLITHDSPKTQDPLTGLETWFTLPGIRTIKPPPKWKMAIATFIGIYPLALLFQILFGNVIAHLPVYIRPFLLAGFMIPLMTFFVMPNITKVLKPWLYPKN